MKAKIKIILFSYAVLSFAIALFLFFGGRTFEAGLSLLCCSVGGIFYIKKPEEAVK